jgi:hypothetical protein
MMGTEEVCTLEQLHVVKNAKRFAFACNLSAVQDVAAIRNVLQGIQIVR